MMWLIFIIPAKQIEETEKDESSDSSDDGEFDDSDVTTTTKLVPQTTTYVKIFHITWR